MPDMNTHTHTHTHAHMHVRAHSQRAHREHIKAMHHLHLNRERDTHSAQRERDTHSAQRERDTQCTERESTKAIHHHRSIYF